MNKEILFFFFKSESHNKHAFEKPVEQTDKPIKNR